MRDTEEGSVNSICGVPSERLSEEGGNSKELSLKGASFELQWDRVHNGRTRRYDAKRSYKIALHLDLEVCVLVRHRTCSRGSTPSSRQ